MEKFNFKEIKNVKKFRLGTEQIHKHFKLWKINIAL